jgi:hypothetical protein
MSTLKMSNSLKPPETGDDYKMFDEKFGIWGNP